MYHYLQFQGLKSVKCYRIAIFSSYRKCKVDSNQSDSLPQRCQGAAQKIGFVCTVYDSDSSSSIHTATLTACLALAPECLF